MSTIQLTANRAPLLMTNTEMLDTLKKCQDFLGALAPSKDDYRTVELLGAYVPAVGQVAATAVVSYTQNGTKEVWRIRPAGGPVKRCVTVDTSSPNYSEDKAKAQVAKFFGLIDNFFATGNIL